MTAAYCLDITRLVSRVGQGAWTGVDRVEHAYLRHLSKLPVPLFLLARTAIGFILIGPDAAGTVLAKLDGAEDWGAPDTLARFQKAKHPDRLRAEADLRRMALARAPRLLLGRMLRRHVPPGAIYLNTGHSNLNKASLSAWNALKDARVTVLVHDTIPLDYPEFQRDGTPKAFERKLRAVSEFADLIICSSEPTRAATVKWLERMGRVPETVVAHLGVDIPRDGPASLPPELTLQRPYFVVTGTIEPRKNHALLLDIWDKFAPDTAPTLVIAGRRGWKNEQVFNRLDRHPLIGTRILEFSNLSDNELRALTKHATALLFPSLAEGYGLPPIEAAALGVPVICSDLPSIRMILNNIPVYLPPTDVYRWENKIRNMAAEDRAGHPITSPPFDPPSWDDHFERVLKAL